MPKVSRKGIFDRPRDYTRVFVADTEKVDFEAVAYRSVPELINLRDWVIDRPEMVELFASPRVPKREEFDLDEIPLHASIVEGQAFDLALEILDHLAHTTGLDEIDEERVSALAESVGRGLIEPEPEMQIVAPLLLTRFDIEGTTNLSGSRLSIERMSDTFICEKARTDSRDHLEVVLGDCATHALVESGCYLVDRKRLFLHALNYCMLLPGPEAQQLATYLGWLTKGTRGGLLAGSLFILPGFLSVLVLSILYAQWGGVAWVEGLFRGIGPAVIAIVAHAVLRIGRRTMKNRVMVAIAIGAFVSIFFFELPFPLIVLAAGVIGFVGARRRREIFVTITGYDAERANADSERVSWRRTALTLVVGLALWVGPVLALIIITGRGSVWSDIAIFFSQAAVVTFGGAYSVLAYMAQQAVDVYGWLEPGEMVDGLGLAETTPGPLIQVTQFVGFLGAHRNPGTLSPVVAGTLGAVLTTWVTFVPSFLWIIAGAPHVEGLKNRPALSGALSTITAAIVGVVLNLGVWFGIYTLFAAVQEREVLGARLLDPVWSIVDWLGVAISVMAAVALFRWKARILHVVVGAAAVGLLSAVV